MGDASIGFMGCNKSTALGLIVVATSLRVGEVIDKGLLALVGLLGEGFVV